MRHLPAHGQHNHVLLRHLRIAEWSVHHSFWLILITIWCRFGFLDELSSTQLYMKLYAAPITVFYRYGGETIQFWKEPMFRFHSSVCLAEIWQKSFARPKTQLTRVSPIAISPQPFFTIVTIDWRSFHCCIKSFALTTNNGYRRFSQNKRTNLSESTWFCLVRWP